MWKQKQCFSLLLAGFCLLFALPAHAQEAILTSDVTMDTTGTDASDARAKAMHQAERDGLDKLLAKLAPDQKDALMGKLSDDIISAMVKSVEVEDEKIAGNRYRASLRVSYNALAVNTLLDKKMGAGTGTPEAPAPSAVLVIPLYVENGKAMLWEPNNPWREAWRRAILEASGGNVLVPYGDTTDDAALSANAVMSANYAALAPFFSRYGVGVVVIVKATFQKGNGAKDQLATMDVVQRDVGQQTNDTYVLNYRADQDEDKPSLLLRVAHDLIDQISRQREEILSREAMANPGTDTGRIMVLIPTTTLDSWTKVRAALTKLQTVTKLDVLAMSPQQVDTMLQFKGPKASLANDITGLGLRLQQFNNYWVVSRE